MILDEIKEKLLEVDKNVFYGAVGSRMKDTYWDYIVFNRTSLKMNTNKTSFTDCFTVHIVREEWIPEGFEQEVIKKMYEIDGMRLAGNDGVYTYTTKPSTNAVIEMLSLDFVKPKKA